ncbi:hypothetical protein HPB51_013618 [Rhipicephalus microplus]|uniref:Uncharacterized protein n=1 Tax=Rhipicephalus microplus TaxID=6941 RepID=A0A9J6EHE5_RHIMP|nr:hypothetical protein HPB51_013618 [Rhipicephalus microplus]
MEEPLPRERKFIMFESFLYELLTNCSICGQAFGNLNFSFMGTLVVVEGMCEQLQKLRWRSQPLVRGSEAGAGNFLLAAGMLTRAALWLQPSDALVLKSSWSAPATTTTGPTCSLQ